LGFVECWGWVKAIISAMAALDQDRLSDSIVPPQQVNQADDDVVAVRVPVTPPAFVAEPCFTGGFTDVDDFTARCCPEVQRCVILGSSSGSEAEPDTVRVADEFVCGERRDHVWFSWASLYSSGVNGGTYGVRQTYIS